MGKLDEIVDGARPAERTVPVCTRGDLNAEIEELQRQLAEVERTWTKKTLADRSPSQQLAQQIEELRARMQADEHVFRFRALDPLEWSNLLTLHPARDGKQEMWNIETFPPACIAACLVAIDGEPETIDIAGAQRLLKVLNSGQRDDVFDAAYRVNVKSFDVPFSPLASKILRDTEQS